MDRVIRYMVGPTLKVVWLLALISIPAFYFFDRLLEPTYDTLITRLVGCIPIGIALYAIYTNKPDRVIAHTSILAATCLLMWMFPTMFMLNAATTPDGGTVHYAWHSMYLVSILLYVQFINNLVVAIGGWLLGFFCSLASIFVVHDLSVPSVLSYGLAPFPIFLTAIIFGNLLNRHTENVERDKTNSAKAIGENIAHELRTPLMGIASRASAVEHLLPELTDVYQSAVIAGMVEEPLRNKQIELLKESLNDIESEAKYANNVINMLLINTSEEQIKERTFNLFTASEALTDSLARYPFPNEKEREMVELVGEPCNALIRAPKLLVEHVIFNLIKNALLQCQRAEKGEIELSATEETGTVTVVVKDTGPGIHPDVLPKIFHRFFTTSGSGEGSGIGLSFCNQVMTDLGGSIACNSVLGEFTEFRMVFPKNGKRQAKK